MAIEFHCSQCRKKLRVPEEKSGKRVKCPGCQGVVMVPSSQMSGADASAQMTGVNTRAQMTGAEMPVQMTGVGVAGPGSRTDLSTFDAPPPARSGASAQMTGVDQPVVTGRSMVAPSQITPAQKKKPAEPEPDPFGGDDIELEVEIADTPAAGKVTEPPPREEPTPASKLGSRSKDRKADEVLEEYGLSDDDGDAVKGPTESIGGKPAPGAAAAAAKKAADNKKAMTVLDGEEEFGGFDLDADAVAAKAGKKKEAAKPAPSDPDLFGKGQTLQTVATADVGSAPPPADEPGKKAGAGGFADILKTLPPAALYGGIAGVVGLIAVIVYFAFFFGDKPKTKARPTPPVAAGTTGTTDSGGGTGENKTSGGTEEPAKTDDRKKTDFEPLAVHSPDEERAAATAKEFWSRYEAAVAAGNGREWKQFAEWCAARGLRSARREALEHARMRDPEDPEVRRLLGQTVAVALPANRQAYTTPEAKALVDRMFARVVVVNRSHPELRVRISGGPGEFGLKLGESRSVAKLKPGANELTFKAGEKTWTSAVSLLPGESYWISFVPPETLPVLPYSALKTSERAVKLAAGGGLAGSAPRGLGPFRVLDVSHDVKKGEYTVRLAGDFPAEYWDTARRRPADRKVTTATLKPAAGEKAAQFEVTEGQTKKRFLVGRADAAGISSGRVFDRNGLLYAADAADLRDYAAADRAAGATPPLTFGPGDRVLSGAADIDVFPVSHDVMCRSAGFDPEAVLSAVERRRFSPLPKTEATPPGADVLTLVRFRPTPNWTWDEFAGYCRWAGATPQFGAAYTTGDLGLYSVVRRFDPSLLDFVNRLSDQTLTASMARYAKDVEGPLAAFALNPRNWQRPYALFLLCWPGNDGALDAVRALATDFVKFDTGGGAVEAMQRLLFNDWAGHVSIPDLIAECLVNIGTEKSIDELRRIAEDPRSGAKLAAAAVPALSRSGHLRAIPFMVDILRRNPTLLNLQAEWVGRWDIPETRRLVDQRLKKGAEADGLNYLARALEQQERGRGNLYLLRRLVEYQPEETELLRIANGQAWKWETQKLEKNARPSRMIPAVAWLLGRRGDLPAAGLLRDYIVANRRPFVESMVKGPESPEFLNPILRENENHSELRYSRFGPAATLYEQAFESFRGPDGAILVSTLIRIAAMDPEIGARQWRPFWVKMLAAMRSPAAAPVLTAFINEKGPEGMSSQAASAAATAAWIGLLSLGDKESLQTISQQSGKALYERIGNITKSFIVQWGGELDTKGDSMRRRTAQLVTALTSLETGLPTPLAGEWNDFVERTAWGALRGLFESVRDPDAGGTEIDALGYHRVVARLKREEQEKALRRAGKRLDSLLTEGADRSARRTALRADLDEEQRAAVVRILTQLVWPDDDFREASVGAEYADLRRQALAALIDLDQPKDLLDRLRKSTEVQSLGPQVLLRLARSGDPADLERIIERTTKDIVLSPQRVLARTQKRHLEYVRVGQGRLNSYLQDAGVRGVRPDPAVLVPLLAHENFDIHEVLKGELTIDAIFVLGRLGDRKAADHLIALVDGKLIPPGNYQTSEGCEREIFRRAAALSALAEIDPKTAREKLVYILQTRDENSFGFSGLNKVGGSSKSDPPALARHRLVLTALFRRACMSAAARVIDDECVPALATLIETRTTDPIGSAQEMTSVYDSERDTAREALRLMLWRGGKAAGPVLTRQLDPVRGERVGITPQSATGKTLLSVVTDRGLSPQLAPALYALLSEPKAPAVFRRWALENLILTGDAAQLALLAAYIGGPDFKRTFEGQFEGGAVLAIFQQIRDPSSSMKPETAVEFYVRLMSTVGAQSDGLVNAAAAREALTALAAFEHPDALKALQTLRDVPRFRHAGSFLLFRRGDLTAIDALAAGAAELKKDDGTATVETLSSMPHIKTLGALLEFVEKSPERDVRTVAAGALYRMTLDLTAGRQGRHDIPPEMTDRIVKFVRGAAPDVGQALSLVLAALAHDAGLEYLGKDAAQTPSSGPDNDKMLTIIDVLASRNGDRLTPGVKGLLESMLIKRRIAKPIGEPLTTSASELAARTKYFEDKSAMDELLRKIGTRTAALEAMLLLDKGRLTAEAKLTLENIRDNRGPAPRGSAKEAAEEAAEAAAALKRAEGR